MHRCTRFVFQTVLLVVAGCSASGDELETDGSNYAGAPSADDTSGDDGSSGDDGAGGDESGGDGSEEGAPDEGDPVTVRPKAAAAPGPETPTEAPAE